MFNLVSAINVTGLFKVILALLVVKALATAKFIELPVISIAPPAAPLVSIAAPMVTAPV